jgi:hypothetical protein
VAAIQLSCRDERKVQQDLLMNSADAEKQPEFFARYLKEAAKWLSVVDLKHRGAAIELSKRPLDALDGVALVCQATSRTDPLTTSSFDPRLLISSLPWLGLRWSG